MSEAGTKRLWAPWRMAYIKDGTKRREGKKKDCPFCELPRKAPSEETLVLYRDPSIFVIMNKFPYNPAHLMVVPRKHLGDPTELDLPTWLRISEGIRGCIDILKRYSNPQGFNLGMNMGVAGGAGIPGHLHWHILPRWNGDTNFMPLIAETKALPTHNVTIYRELKPLFAGFEKRLDAVKLKP